MNKILLVVLYKKNASQSSTIQSFVTSCKKYHKFIKLVICDNSPYFQDKLIRDEIPHQINYEYYHRDNEKLSAWYNYIAGLNPNSILHIFDQDSYVDEDYFDKNYEAIVSHPNINLFIPYIKTGNQYDSPAKRKLYKGIFIDHITPGINSSNHLLCIASGMTLKTNFIIDEIQFDTNLTFYGIDSKFCIDYSNRYSSYYLIDYQLRHSLSKYEKESSMKKLWRINNQNHAVIYISKQISHIAFVTCIFGCAYQYLKFVICLTRSYLKSS